MTNNTIISEEDSLIEYPCAFTVKVMGAALPEFRTKIMQITQKHDPQFNETKVKEKFSKGNKYLSLSLTIWAEDRAQLDALYEELTSCELSLWVI
ncbi:MAG TPA: DUF493 domain-containing protein [Thiotrichaceae bacterium]|nr:DUF493 domain-containing protein [Thiotrichaceae bacterium]